MTRVARLMSVQGTPAASDKPAVPGPNADLFAGGTGGATLDVAALTKIAHDEFESGATYDVVITKRE